MKKIAIALVFIMLFATVLSGCSGMNATPSETKTEEPAESVNESSEEEAVEEEAFHIVFSTPLTGHPVWLDAKRGFEDALKEEGATGEWVGPQGVDVNQMIIDVESAIAQKADAIITCDINPSAFAPVLKKAEEASIPVALINTDDPESGRLISVGTEPINVVRKAAPEIIKALDGEAPKVILMQSDMTVQTQIDQINEYKSIFSKLDGYVLNAHEIDEADMLKATDKIYNLLMTYPDTNVLVTVAANGAPAASKVIQENNLEGIIVVGVDDLDETIAGIKAGSILGTCTQNFYKMGYLSTKALINFLRTGEEPEQAVVDSGTIFVSQENINTYKEEMMK